MLALPGVVVAGLVLEAAESEAGLAFVLASLIEFTILYAQAGDSTAAVVSICGAVGIVVLDAVVRLLRSTAADRNTSLTSMPWTFAFSILGAGLSTAYAVLGDGGVGRAFEHHQVFDIIQFVILCATGAIVGPLLHGVLERADVMRILSRTLGAIVPAIAASLIAAMICGTLVTLWATYNAVFGNGHETISTDILAALFLGFVVIGAAAGAAFSTEFSGGGEAVSLAFGSAYAFGYAFAIFFVVCLVLLVIGGIAECGRGSSHADGATVSDHASHRSNGADAAVVSSRYPSGMLRDGPAGSPVGSIRGGQPIHIDSRSRTPVSGKGSLDGDWYQVTVDGTNLRGWMHATVIEIRK
jgi:hypothetical protein